MTQVVEILPQIGQELTYSTQSKSWVLMPCQGISNHDIDSVEQKINRPRHGYG